jgi:hypothetical protein
MSSSTDGAVKLWRQEEGRGQLVYPWFELQVGPRTCSRDSHTHVTHIRM